jgi:hypothetical protein
MTTTLKCSSEPYIPQKASIGCYFYQVFECVKTNKEHDGRLIEVYVKGIKEKSIEDVYLIIQALVLKRILEYSTSWLERHL